MISSKTRASEETKVRAKKSAARPARRAPAKSTQHAVLQRALDADARIAAIGASAGIGVFELTVTSGQLENEKNQYQLSSRCRELLGLGDEHLENVAAAFGAKVHPDDQKRVSEAFFAHVADRSGKTPCRVDFRARSSGDEYRWYRASANTVRDDNSELLRVIGTVEDVNEQRESVTVLQSAITRAELYNQASGVALWDMSVIAGDPINPNNEFWWSQQFRQMLGFRDASDFPDVLDSWASRLHPLDKERILAAFGGHLNDHSGKTPYDVEYRLQLKTGEYRWFRATGATLRDERGVPLRVAGALKDIHEEKQTALALQNALTRGDLINLASGVALWDMSVIAGDPINPKNEFWWSQQFRQMLGFRDASDFPDVLDSWASRLHPLDKERILAAFGGHLNDHSGKTPYDVEYRLQLKTGEYRWFRATGATMRDAHGVPLRVAGALKDIHAEKETVIALEALISAAVEGDLTQRLAVERYEGTMRTISESMNRLLDSTSESFRSVKSAIDQVGQASTQLRATSQMMSVSSVELKSNVDHSSTELSRVSDGVKANAEHAAMANALVTATASAARGGEQRMEEMSGAMAAINSSSRQIARIIKVIDEIAFQTNLLALNAAVEAARAGRHGKGFAVVAQEVRNLAERSANAARETAELIEDSTGKVDEGVKIADSTRAALGDIVSNVGRVVDLVGDIAAASGEQAHALDSVSGSMVMATTAAQAGSQQSNEVAAASDELSRQMTVLKERMDRYKIAPRPRAAMPGLPNGATPELVDQIILALQARGHALPGIGDGQRAENDQRAHAMLQRTGTDAGVDSAQGLPPGQDERSFNGF